MKFYYVYILTTVSGSKQRYVGYTEDLEQRLRDHNRGKSDFTGRWGTWQFETVVAVRGLRTAIALERYLKSGSGREFARRHLRPTQSVSAE